MLYLGGITAGGNLIVPCNSCSTFETKTEPIKKPFIAKSHRYGKEKAGLGLYRKGSLFFRTC